MKHILPSKSVTIALGLSVCGIGGYLLYLLLKKDDEYKATQKRSNYKTLEVSIPKEHVRSFIGRNGKNIKALQEESHTRISFKDDDNDEQRTCVIRGNRDACIHAKSLILEFIGAQPVLKSDEMIVPQNVVGKIIGRCGENIMEITTRSGAKVTVCNDKAAAHRKVLLKGTEEQINCAKLLITNIIKTYQLSQNELDSTLAKREPRAPPKSPTVNGTKGDALDSPTMLNGSPKVERMSPYPGQTGAQFEVYISAMLDPSHFWMQIVGPKATELDQLVEEMTEYYAKDENRDLHVLNSLEVGDVVAAVFKFDKKWYRAEVLKVMDNGGDSHVELYYVDYGDTDVIPSKEAFELRTDFLRLHFQAIECFLAQIEPKDGKWSDEALDKFEELAHVAQWKKLLAKINCYWNREKLTAKRESSPVPGIDLYDFNNDTDVDIAKELVDHGYAVFKNGCDPNLS
ncbi:hypothetical protein PPYR_12660 [Photinus pyralis]|uniref:Tudor domain-containing protein n=1 Tax=Photinus pyralis TaxID=7054 RepID=A0A1Y1K1L9_PHOPY|nr:tudor and KH domain-containing protein homolog [Photinus pyralis]KAB0793040.1 hypothetical protein PPYR_12660 [Photinus pyralis]